MLITLLALLVAAAPLVDAVKAGDKAAAIALIDKRRAIAGVVFAPTNAVTSARAGAATITHISPARAIARTFVMNPPDA